MLEIEHLSFDVQDEGRQSEILSDISFHVADGEMLVITGPKRAAANLHLPNCSWESMNQLPARSF